MNSVLKQMPRGMESRTKIADGIEAAINARRIEFIRRSYIFAVDSLYQSRIAHGHDINAVRFISNTLNQNVRKSLDLEKSHTALGRSKFAAA